MIVGRHVITNEIVVLADDKGLPVPMMRNADGHWREDSVDALTLMEDVVEIRDTRERRALLVAALKAFRHAHPIAAVG